MGNDRWAVTVEGDLIDLEDLTRQYPPPNEIRVMKVSVSSDLIVTALLADDFHQLTNATEVHGIAQLIVTRMSGILFARDAERSIIRLGSVYRRTEDEQWELAPVVHEGRGIAAGTARVRAYAEVLSPDGSLQAAPPPEEPKWLRDAEDEDAVADVLQLLSGESGWFILYMAFERMRDNINRIHGSARPRSAPRTSRRSSKPKDYAFVGWPDTSHFRKSAMVYRHSKPKWPEGYDLQNAMSLSDAHMLVSHLLKSWLEWRCRNHPSSS